MSLYVPKEGSFELPENPVPDESIDAVAHEALDWILATIPFDPTSQIYRPELASNGGNCYAQAVGGVALLHEWGIDSGVVLAGHHAHIVIGKGKEVRFIDPHQKQITTPDEETAKIRGGNAAKLYKSNLPMALAEGTFVHYYYQDAMRRRTLWRSFKATAIRGVTNHIKMTDPHIIVDAAQGIDMLLACGDLSRYAHQKPETFHDEYYNLIGTVPDFKNPGADQATARAVIRA